MGKLIPKYKEYSRILGIYTLAIRIRQYSWWIRELLKSINQDIKKIKNKTRKLKNRQDIMDITDAAQSLGSEFKSYIHYLKIIYFHNSAILHHHLNYLLNFYKRVKEEKKKEIKLKRKEKNIKIIRQLEKKMRIGKKEIKDIAKVDKDLLKAHRLIWVGFSKMLRNGFNPRTVTLLKQEWINKRIKISSRKIKETELKRRKAMAKLDIYNEKHIRKITHFFKKEVHLIDKEIVFVEQLIKKIKSKRKEMEHVSKRFDKKLHKLGVKGDAANKILSSFRKPFRELDQLIDKDSKEMYYNALRQRRITWQKSKVIRASA